MKQRLTWTRLLPSPVVNNIATLGPLGFWGKAPGTIGSIAGMLWFTTMFLNLSPIGFLIFLIFTAYLATEICGEAEKRMLKRDPPEIILDEFVAMPLCYLGIQPYIFSGTAWHYMLAGFIVFRFFDIIKPLGINKLQALPGGLGIVLDDLGSAMATCLTLHIGLWGLKSYGII